MKLYKNEYQRFSELIDKHLGPTVERSFTKKRGHLTIAIQGEMFKYYRKKETVLDDNLKWKDVFHFFIFEDKRKIEVANFDVVLSAFKDWLLARF